MVIFISVQRAADCLGHKPRTVRWSGFESSKLCCSVRVQEFCRQTIRGPFADSPANNSVQGIFSACSRTFVPELRTVRPLIPDCPQVFLLVSSSNLSTQVRVSKFVLRTVWPQLADCPQFNCAHLYSVAVRRCFVSYTVLFLCCSSWLLLRSLLRVPRAALC